MNSRILRIYFYLALIVSVTSVKGATCSIVCAEYEFTNKVQTLHEGLKAIYTNVWGPVRVMVSSFNSENALNDAISSCINAGATHIYQTLVTQTQAFHSHEKTEYIKNVPVNIQNSCD